MILMMLVGCQQLDLEDNKERDRGIAMTRICAENLFYNDRSNRAVVIVSTGECD